MTTKPQPELLCAKCNQQKGSDFHSKGDPDYAKYYHKFVPGTKHSQAGQTTPLKISPELSEILEEANDHVAKWEPWQRSLDPQAGQTPEQGGPRTKKWRELAGNESLPAPSPEKAGAEPSDVPRLRKLVARLNDDQFANGVQVSTMRFLLDAAQSTQALREASNELGKWMSAALDDPKVCAEMKADIERWFAALANSKEMGG